MERPDEPRRPSGPLGEDWVDPGPGEPAPEKGGGGGRRFRWRRRLLAYSLLLVGLVMGALFFLLRTQPGQRVVLTELLERLQDAVNGRILVDDIRSGDLREGVTLIGVRIEGPSGRPFFMADSVRATYAWRTFLSRDVILSSLDVFGPVLLVTRYPGEERFNADVIFRSGEEAADTTAGPIREVIFDDVTLHGGTVRVVYPEEGPIPDRALTVTTPAGETLRRLAFDDVNAVIPRAEILTADTDGPTVRVEDLSMLARLYEEPARLNDLEGTVAWANSTLTVHAEEVVIGATRASGTVVADFGRDDGIVLTLDMTSPEARLADFHWIEPRLPDGVARGHVGLVISPTGLSWTFDDMFADLGESRITADGDWVMAEGGMSFDGLALDFEPLDLDRVRPWVDFDIPLRGSVRGTAILTGEPDDLSIEGHLTLDEPGTGPPSTGADFRGVFHLTNGFGVTGLNATLDPLDYDLLPRLFPSLVISGEGRVRLEATGHTDSGLRFTADIVHRDQGVPTSMVLAEGSVREVGGELVLDVTADAGPLSFTALRRYYPDLPVSGEVRGTIRAQGPLSNVRLTTDLDTPAGRLALESRFDARDPGARYEVRGDLSRFQLSAIAPELPDPTVFSGSIDVRGTGRDLSTADVRARLRTRQARVGGLHVDTATAAIRITGGVLHVDTLDAVVGGVDVNASGTLAVREGAPAPSGALGEIRIAFETDSIGKLRPLLLGDVVIARDSLGPLDVQLLELEGVDVDTLPTTDEVELAGAGRGEVVLRGSLESFSAEGEATFERLSWGEDFVRGARVTFSATDLPSLDGAFHAEVEADSLSALGMEFQRVALDLDYTRPGGRFDLLLIRHEDEDYRARALFELDPEGGRLDLEEMTLRFDTLAWRLARPASIDWEGTGITVDDLVLERPGPDPMRMAVSGRLPREGEADFTVDVEGVSLGRVASILQREDLGLEGMVSTNLRVTGSAAEPVITGTLLARDVEYEAFGLTRIEGEIGYRDRRIVLDLGAWRDDLRVLTATGTVPADLSLAEVEDRLPSEEIDLRVVADSLPATFVFSMLQDLEEVEGTVDGEFTIAGTIEDPSPSGVLVLNDAGFLVDPVGVRYRDVEGTLELRPDGTVDVNASARADGTVVVTGTVDLEPLTDPGFDLLMVFDDFRAVNRRDVEGNVSGRATLTGRFRQPIIQGLESEGMGLEVDQGVLFLEEFQRSATVVDLSDPRFFDLQDTTLVRAQPVLAGSQNPFMRNLRVNVDLAVDGDVWLRSEEMNVEIAGDLVVVYDRRENDVVLVGELEAVRGDYTLYGRRFQVQEGVVEFVGTPGINPNLNITAETRLRRPDAQPLEIAATVSGTLLDPAVSLSSPEAAVAQEDLISYLIFGQPTYALTTGQAASVQSAARSLLGQGVGVGLSLAAGTLTSRIGTLVAQEIGVDYFAISQPTDILGTGFAAFQETTVEIGQYIDEDLFAVVVLQPFRNLGGSTNIFAGARLEWAPSDLYTVEFFVEDRFLRSRTLGLQDVGFQQTLVYGVSVFWEWGY